MSGNASLSSVEKPVEPAEPIGEDGLTDKERQELNLQTAAFESLERDFREVLSELVGDKSLERFRLEYEKLHHTLKKSHENEKRLIKKCRELNSEIVANAVKIQTALRLSMQDQQSIQLLKKEIDKAWKMVDQAQDKERKARETIQRLKGEIGNLSRLVDQGAGLNIGQENAVNELLKQQEQMQRQMDEQVAEIERLRLQASESAREAEDLRSKLSLAEVSQQQLNDRVSALKAQQHNEQRRTETLKQEVLQVKKVNEEQNQTISVRSSQITALQQQVQQLESQLAAAKHQIADRDHEVARQNDERDLLKRRVDELSINHRQLLDDREQLQQQNAQLHVQIQQAQSNVKSLEKQIGRLNDDRLKLHEEHQQHEQYRAQLRDEMKSVTKLLEMQRKDANLDEKMIRDLEAQLQRLQQSLALSHDRQLMQKQQLDDIAQQQSQYERDIEAHKAQEQKLAKELYEVERKREKLSTKLSAAQSQVAEMEQKLQLKDFEITELHQTLAEERAKLRMQQNLYEQLRSDRNLFSKQKSAADDEIAEMKRKFKIMEHQIEQLKEEIAAKDAALINEHFAQQRLREQMTISKRKLAKRQQVLMKADTALSSQYNEIKQLRRTLHESEQIQQQQRHIFDDVIQERDLLAAQLIRRNDELALLQEKLRLQQSTLHHGELEYQRRLDDCRVLRLQVIALQRSLQLQFDSIQQGQLLKQELFHVQRQLVQERTKVKALSEELENPMNVHRWRKLEGSDPKRYELLQKIQLLQKRLLTKTEQLVERDLQLKDKERVHEEMRSLLSRQVGPEAI